MPPQFDDSEGGVRTSASSEAYANEHPDPEEPPFVRVAVIDRWLHAKQKSALFCECALDSNASRGHDRRERARGQQVEPEADQSVGEHSLTAGTDADLRAESDKAQ